MKRTMGWMVVLVVSLCSAVNAQDKKVLFLTKSAGFEHSVVKRDPKAYDKLAHAEVGLTEIGAKNGFEVTCTKDASLFNDPETYKKYDVFAFYTTGDLTKDSNHTQVEKGMSKEGYEMFQKSIADGKGFIAFHCGSDTFHSPDFGKTQFACSPVVSPYIQMLGGEFLTHQSQQNSKIKVASAEFPGMKGVQDFEMKEEWYSLKNFAPDLHVILVQDTDSMKTDKGQRESSYVRPAFPETWARMEGKGRVFYTSMGHREDVWTNPTFQQVTVAGLNWASGKTQFDPKPNVKEITPGAETIKK